MMSVNWCIASQARNLAASGMVHTRIPSPEKLVFGGKQGNPPPPPPPAPITEPMEIIIILLLSSSSSPSSYLHVSALCNLIRS